MRPPNLYIVAAGVWPQFFGLLRRTFVASYEDGVFSIAKGAAYSALTAFFPVLASMTAILVQANAEEISRVLSEFLFEVVPPGSDELVRYEFAVRGQRPGWLLVVATIFSIWAASGAMLSLMEGFQAAYRIPTGRPFLAQRLIAVLLVVLVAIPALAASLIILFGSRTESILPAWTGIAARPIIGRTMRYITALGAIVLSTGQLYYVGPNRPMKLASVWPGALLATALWLATTSGFAWYVRNIANYNVLYGSIGAVIALLIWMYLLAVIALFGCEFNAERERALTL